LGEDDELAALLAAHNQARSRAKTTYVPRLFSTAQIRQWEQAQGKRWQELNNEERDRANLQMQAMFQA
jgi:hypothetical protein